MTNGRDAIAYLETDQADVVLMDIGLPDRSGLAVGREILERWPETRLLAVTALDDARAVAMPGMPIIEESTPDGVFTMLAALGYAEGALFTADTPDLPALLAAKPFSGLSISDAAVPGLREYWNVYAES